MQVLSQLLGCKGYGAEPHSSVFVTDDRLGIEIELEGFSAEDYQKGTKIPLWSIKEDGSLRNNGVEFVTQGGIGGQRLEQAIENIVGFLDTVEFNASWRCSTHMHVNMLDFNVEQILKYVLAYICVEPIMFDFCDPSRRQSNFCVLLSNSLQSTRDMVYSINKDWPVQRVRGVKYMALNILPIGNENLGTVEFRGSHALTTKEELTGLAQRLLSIKRFVREFGGSIDEMLTAIQAEGWRMMLTHGVPEGYVGNEFEIERAQMLSWSCWKYHQKNTANSIQPLPSLSAGPRRGLVAPPGGWFTTDAAFAASQGSSAGIPEQPDIAFEDRVRDQEFMREFHDWSGQFMREIQERDFSTDDAIIHLVGDFVTGIENRWSTRVSRKFPTRFRQVVRCMCYQYIPILPLNNSNSYKINITQAMDAAARIIMNLLSDIGWHVGREYSQGSAAYNGVVAAGLSSHVPPMTRRLATGAGINWANYRIEALQYVGMSGHSFESFLRTIKSRWIRLTATAAIQDILDAEGIGTRREISILEAFHLFQFYGISSARHVSRQTIDTYRLHASVLAWMFGREFNMPQLQPWSGHLALGRITTPSGLQQSRAMWRIKKEENPDRLTNQDLGPLGSVSYF